MKQKGTHRPENKLSLRIIGFVFLYNLFITVSGLSGFIMPRDAVVFIGESLRVVCSVPDSIDYLKLCFKLETKNGSWFVPSNRSAFDNSSVEANININESFSHITTVSCLYGVDILDSTTIYAERPLKNISNFGGYFLRSHTSFSQVEWSLDADYYLNVDNIHTRVNYSNGIPQDWREASACDVTVSANKGTCVVKYNGKLFINFLFTISLKNAMMRPDLEYLQPLFETEIRDLKKFDMLQNTKTGPVTDVNVVETTANCTTVRWVQPYFLKFMCKSLCPVISYQAKFVTDTGVEDKVIEGSVQNSETAEPVELCGLTPFTTYSLEVRVKEKDLHPWSDPSEPVRLTTKEDKPLTGPEVSATNYHIDKPCQDGRRKICVYWNPQSPSFVRGNVIAYEVRIASLNVWSKQRKSSNFWCSNNLPCNKSTDIEIYTVTKPGRSLLPSVIHVPSQAEELEVPQPSQMNFLAREEHINGSRRLIITWNTETASSNSLQTFDDSYVIVLYMCEESVNEKCYDDYQRREIKAEAHKITIENVEQSINLLGYALQSRTGAYKTGIYWSDCIYQDHLLPSMPSQVRAYGADEHASLTVEWLAEHCNRHTKVLVEKYHLSLCTLSDNIPANPWENPYSTCQKISVPSQQGGRYTFRDLRESQTYRVYLWAESPKGMSPRASVEGRTRQRSKDEPDIKSIIAFVVSAIILVAMVLLCVIYQRKNKKRRKDDHRCQQLIEQDDEKPREEKQKPSMIDRGHLNKAYERNVSEDSGVDIISFKSQPPSPLRIQDQRLSDLSSVDFAPQMHVSTAKTQRCGFTIGPDTTCGISQGREIVPTIKTQRCDFTIGPDTCEINRGRGLDPDAIKHPETASSMNYISNQTVQDSNEHRNINSAYIQDSQIERSTPVKELESDFRIFSASRSEHHVTDSPSLGQHSSYACEEQEFAYLPNNGVEPHLPSFHSKISGSGETQDKENKIDKPPEPTFDNMFCCQKTKGDDRDLDMTNDPPPCVQVNQQEGSKPPRKIETANPVFIAPGQSVLTDDDGNFDMTSDSLPYVQVNEIERAKHPREIETANPTFSATRPSVLADDDGDLSMTPDSLPFVQVSLVEGSTSAREMKTANPIFTATGQSGLTDDDDDLNMTSDPSPYFQVNEVESPREIETANPTFSATGQSVLADDDGDLSMTPDSLPFVQVNLVEGSTSAREMKTANPIFTATGSQV